MSKDESWLNEYADLIVGVGANVAEGQDVTIYAMVEHAPLVRALASASYRRGATFVEAVYDDQLIRRALVEHGPATSLKREPAHLDGPFDDLGNRRSALIWVGGNPHPGWMDDLDPKRAMHAGNTRVRGALMRQITSGRVNWTTVCAPTEGWATAVFGEPDVARLWEAVRSAARLDQPDPVASWEEQADKLRNRTRVLTKKRIQSLRVVGPGTDLKVGLLPRHVWRSADLQTVWGRRHLANLPTEEVFATPDPSATQGSVRITRPLVIPGGGGVVTDLSLSFADGRLQDVHGGPHLEVLLESLSIDEGARYLGEIALVDETSRVGRLDLLFFETLFDENASSHIALGQSYPSTVRTASPATKSEEYGTVEGNRSAVHVDMAIGGREVSIIATDDRGRELLVMEGDEWRLE